MRPTITLVMLATLLSGCGSVGRLKQIGKPPRMSTADTAAPPVIEPSLGDQTYAHRGAGDLARGAPPPPNASLFRTGAGAFFHDQRASRKGDVLTVRVRIADKAVLDNATSRARSGSENAGLPSFLGLLGKGASTLIDGSSTSKSSGVGNTARSEQIDTIAAAIVTDVLPNGNLLVQGRQEVRVNFELRELLVSGIVRPQDIARDNSVLSSQLAEARISYGGRGQLTDAQQQRWGQQIYDALFPF